MDTVKRITDSELKNNNNRKKNKHMENKIWMKRENVISLFINRVEFFFLMFDKELSITSLLKYCGRSLSQFSSLCLWESS